MLRWLIAGWSDTAAAALVHRNGGTCVVTKGPNESGCLVKFSFPAFRDISSRSVYCDKAYNRMHKHSEALIKTY